MKRKRSTRTTTKSNVAEEDEEEDVTTLDSSSTTAAYDDDDDDENDDDYENDENNENNNNDDDSDSDRKKKNNTDDDDNADDDNNNIKKQMGKSQHDEGFKKKSKRAMKEKVNDNVTKTTTKVNDVKDKNKKDDEASCDVWIPTSMVGTNNNNNNNNTTSQNTGGECMVMIEVDPADGTVLDFEGVSGAIGRFEADGQGVILDLKGCRYRGSILPGPTALVVGMSKGFGGVGGGEMRVEGITDEFVHLVKTQDVMAQLDAIYEGEEEEVEERVEDNK